MLYEGGGNENEDNDNKQIRWWSRIIQQIQMKRLSDGLDVLPIEKYLSNNGTNVAYFVANKIANKAVRLQFNLDRTYKKSEMTPEMLVFRQHIMEDIVAHMLAKYKGKIQHMSPLIYENIVARVVENKNPNSFSTTEIQNNKVKKKVN